VKNFGGQIDAALGQAAARGQFALFDKGRALRRWYQRHGAGSKGQGADHANAPRYRLLVIVRVRGSASRGGGSGVAWARAWRGRE